MSSTFTATSFAPSSSFASTSSSTGFFPHPPTLNDANCDEELTCQRWLYVTAGQELGQALYAKQVGEDESSTTTSKAKSSSSSSSSQQKLQEELSIISDYASQNFTLKLSKSPSNNHYQMDNNSIDLPLNKIKLYGPRGYQPRFNDEKMRLEFRFEGALSVLERLGLADEQLIQREFERVVKRQVRTAVEQELKALEEKRNKMRESEKLAEDVRRKKFDGEVLHNERYEKFLEQQRWSYRILAIVKRVIFLGRGDESKAVSDSEGRSGEKSHALRSVADEDHMEDDFMRNTNRSSTASSNSTSGGTSTNEQKTTKTNLVNRKQKGILASSAAAFGENSDGAGEFDNFDFPSSSSTTSTASTTATESTAKSSHHPQITAEALDEEWNLVFSRGVPELELQYNPSSFEPNASTSCSNITEDGISNPLVTEIVFRCTMNTKCAKIIGQQAYPNVFQSILTYYYDVEQALPLPTWVYGMVGFGFFLLFWMIVAFAQARH
ncbi:unnamed protein product [Amoebophrya sp. A120]|nr:unnamed protein product [Amoebophrya sp. A120]|eukprot:GSA120T00013431001.1